MNNKKCAVTFEDSINELLNGEAKEIALKFASHLNEKQLSPVMGNFKWWRVPYWGYHLCVIKYEHEKWIVQFFEGKYDGEYNDGFIQSAHNHVKQCTRCVGNCGGGKPYTVFGKDFDNVCVEFFIQYENPTADDLEHILTLIEHSKNIAPYSDSWHARDAAEESAYEMISETRRDEFIEKLNNLTLDETVDVDLESMVKNGDITLFHKNGYLHISGDDKGRAATPQEFRAPLIIQLRAKTSGAGVHIHYAKGRLLLNWNKKPDELRINNISGKSEVNHYSKVGRLPANEFVDIEWVIEKEYMAVKVNDEIRHIGNNFDYIREFALNSEYTPSATVRLTTARDSVVTVESLRVTELN